MTARSRNFDTDPLTLEETGRTLVLIRRDGTRIEWRTQALDEQWTRPEHEITEA